MDTYKIEITIDNLDFETYTKMLETLKSINDNSKHEIKMSAGKNDIESSEPHLPLGDVSGSLQCDSPVDALREWINLEITERRDYTASKTYEEVLKKINILFPDKCICKTVAQAEDCERNCGSMGQ